MQLNRCSCGEIPQEAVEKRLSETYTVGVIRYLCQCGNSTKYYDLKRLAAYEWNASNSGFVDCDVALPDNVGSLHVDYLVKIKRMKPQVGLTSFQYAVAWRVNNEWRSDNMLLALDSYTDPEWKIISWSDILDHPDQAESDHAISE